MNDHYPDSDKLEKDIDHIVDTEGLSPSDARAKILGWFAADSNVPTHSRLPRLPGKPLTSPPSGHVRDWHEPRAERVEFKAVPITTDEKRVFRDALNKSHAESDFDWLVELQELYLASKLDIKTATARLTVKFGAEALEIANELFGDGTYKSSVIRLADRKPEDF